MSQTKVLSVVGARPQFVKLAPMARAFEGRFEHVIAHTGQHYDDAMSKVFFQDLALPNPQYNLGVGSGSHAVQTASMMTGLEAVVVKEQPDVVVVFGDTNSTLAAALVAAKLNTPIAHIEAGLRSFNRSMPEEINRILVDRVSHFLFCPTETAVKNLIGEGMGTNVHNVGDVMLDALMMYRRFVETHTSILDRLTVCTKEYYLATVHRASNTDDSSRLVMILEALAALDAPVIFPVHPRSLVVIKSHTFASKPWRNVKFIDPVGYLDMLALQLNARKVLTDSGGVQKEAYLLGTPCVTLRDETEWVETLESGWNILAGTEKDAIIIAAKSASPEIPTRHHFGDGHASEKITNTLLAHLG
jgi:UDP-N-acetylglucosamine 2-epimerase